MISAGSLVRVQSGPPRRIKKKQKSTVFKFESKGNPRTDFKIWAKKPDRFFDIYIQGSKYNFKKLKIVRESETRIAASKTADAREFSYQICGRPVFDRGGAQ